MCNCSCVCRGWHEVTRFKRLQQRRNQFDPFDNIRVKHVCRIDYVPSTLKRFCIDPETNNIYISDCDNHKVLLFSETGKLVSSFGSGGNGNDQLLYPWGICICDSLILVADCANRRIQVLDLHLNWISSISVGHYPHEMCISGTGEIIICADNNKIVILNKGRTEIKKFIISKWRASPNYIMNVSESSSGQIILIDWNKKVYSFNPDTEEMISFDCRKITVSPEYEQGTNANDYIYVGDNDIIYVLALNAGLVKQLSGIGGGGRVATVGGNIVVLNSNLNQITVYSN